MKMITVLFLISTCTWAGNLSTLIGGGSGGASGPTFAGYTTSSFSGNLGGITGANAKCQAEFPGSYICSVSEYVRTGVTTNPVGYAWILPDSPNTTGNGGTNGLYYGCFNFTNNSGTLQGGVISNGGYSVLSCSSGASIVCCK